MTLDDLERPILTLANTISGKVYVNDFTEVSRNMKYMQIFAGVPRGGGIKHNTCYLIPAPNFHQELQLFSRLASYINRYYVL